MSDSVLGDPLFPERVIRGHRAVGRRESLESETGASRFYAAGDKLIVTCKRSTVL